MSTGVSTAHVAFCASPPTAPESELSLPAQGPSQLTGRAPSSVFWLILVLAAAPSSCAGNAWRAPWRSRCFQSPGHALPVSSDAMSACHSRVCRFISAMHGIMQRHSPHIPATAHGNSYPLVPGQGQGTLHPRWVSTVENGSCFSHALLRGRGNHWLSAGKVFHGGTRVCHLAAACPSRSRTRAGASRRFFRWGSSATA